MSIFTISHRLLLLGGLVAALGASTVQAQLPTELITVKASDDPATIPADSIVTNTTLTKDKIWILRGYVLVKSGVTLTIEPGTTIRGDATVKGTLMVDRGGKLIAAGTAEAPITFEGPKDNNERGTWGGIVILGRAFSNQSLGSLIPYEALDWALYSGNADDNDSSGVLTYVRLSNPGFAILSDRELNGVTLCAVGRKTVIHHVQVHRGDDDGFEWFGGTVNTDHLVVTNTTDDSYDTDHGYSGNSQFMIAIQNAEPNRPRTNPIYNGLGEIVGDRGLECGSSAGIPGRYTNPVWKNITFIENGASGGAFEAKEECGGSYENMVLVAGAVSDSTSAWAINLVSPKTVNGIATLPPYLDFKNTFITGKYKKTYNITGTAFQIENATAILNQKIKAFPFSQINSYGLNKDLSASHPQIIASGAGAIVGNDLWYQGWTLPGTVTFPKGDSPQTGAPTALTLVSDPTTLPYAPATFTLNATATDPDGISLLEILRDGIMVASSPTASVSFIVLNAAKGSHTFSVRATDNNTNKLTATQDFSFVVQFKPNAAAPAVTLTRTGNATLFAPAAITLNAGAIDADGIASLEILKGSDVIASNTGLGNLAFDLSGLAVGSYLYTVRAKDAHSDDAKTTTLDLLVEVKANQAPEVTLKRADDANLIAPAGLTLIATATDADGAIANLQILQGTEVLGTAAAGALSVPVTGKPAGTYVYTVKATDNNPVDPKTVTKELIITVFDPPTIVNAAAPIVTLVRGDDKALIAPASFKLFASAGDADGIDTLEVLLDGVVVATGTATSLEVPVSGKAAGTYTYKARAKDKHPTDQKLTTKDLVIEVAAPAPNVAAPTLTFTNTFLGTLTSPASFSIFAEATDADGIDTLQIFLDGNVIGTSTTGALLVSLAAKPAGKYTFTARAKDKHGTDSKATNKDLIVNVSTPVSLVKPLKDLDGVRFSASRGQNLVLQSAGFGSVKVAVWALSGRKITMRNVNLVKGENAIRMGNLRGAYIVRLSTGSKSRSTRVVFSVGQ